MAPGPKKTNVFRVQDGHSSEIDRNSRLRPEEGRYATTCPSGCQGWANAAFKSSGMPSILCPYFERIQYGILIAFVG